jgi:carbonic anhydrase
MLGPVTENRTPWLTLRPDLGIKVLARTGREAWSRATLREDALAGLTIVGPSFAIALLVAHHAGLPVVGALLCAVVGSLIVALLGGTRFGLSGPGLAMGLVLMEVGRSHGPAGLALACGLTGLFQLALGVLGLGRFARILPLTVVHAFTFGVGALIVVRCLPQVLGVETSMNLEALYVIDHVVAQITATRWPALLIAGVTLAVMLGAAKYERRFPVALLLIVVAAVITGLTGVDIPTLPDVPVSIAAPAMPDYGGAQFVGSVVMLFALATTETLLSTAADEEQVPGTRNDLSQDLIGHGVANMLLSALGGIPVAGSILRTAAMRRTGAQTRAAVASHGLIGAVLLPLVLFFGHFVPLAVLAGVVIAHAIPLLDPRPLRAVAKVSPAEAIVLGVTGFIIVFADLLTGIEAAFVATLVLATLRVARFRATLYAGRDGATHQVNFSGPITFLSVPELDRIRTQLATIDPSVGVILDIRSVLAIDVTGCMRFLALVGNLIDREGRVALLGASPACRQKLVAADERGLLADRMAVSDHEVDEIIGQARAFEMRAHVIANLERFRIETREHYSPLFDQLASGQRPHTLFVTCVDSRISPTMFTGAHPGELFILRCLGGIVAPPGGHAEGAAVEYALGVLGVRNIVICGHSQCGAIKAIKTQHVPEGFPSLEQWLAGVGPASGDLSGFDDVDDAARAVTVHQLANLREFPAVVDHLADGRLRLMAWFYDVGKADLFEWDEVKQDFHLLIDRAP